jgi:hypothetical protein
MNLAGYSDRCPRCAIPTARGSLCLGCVAAPAALPQMISPLLVADGVHGFRAPVVRGGSTIQNRVGAGRVARPGRHLFARVAGWWFFILHALLVLVLMSAGAFLLGTP